MRTFIDKFDNLILYLRQKSSGLVYSCIFPLISALIVLFFWIANLQVVGLFAIVSITSFVLIVHDDFLPIISLMFMIPMSFRNTTVAFENELVLCVLIFLILISSIIIHFVKYPMKKIELDSFFFSILSIIGIFLVGGLFSGNSEHYFGGIGIFLMSGIVPLLVHFFFYNKVKLDSKVDIKKYVCASFIIAISLASAELCFAKLHISLYGHETYGYIPGGFCWANSNHIASLVLIAVPLCCYMMLSSKRIWAWIIELFFLYLTVLLSGSDGAFATLGLFTPFLMFVVCKNIYRHNLPTVKFIFSGLFLIAIFAFSFIYLFFSTDLLSFIHTSSNSTGRTLSYQMALQFFFESPIFGIGLGGGKAKLDPISHILNYNGFYHSTFYHVIACTGVVGIVTYVFYYMARMKYLAHKDTLLGNFALYAFIMFGLYGLIENNEFNIVLLFMTTLITIVGLINKKGSDDMPLPLWIKIPTYCSFYQSCK